MSYRMPAEWESHDACWMAWPCRKTLWQNIEQAKKAYASVAEAISQFELVYMVCHPDDERECQAAVGDYAIVIAWLIDDSWMRDSGPVFVLDEKNNLVCLNFQFNGWGQKFLPYNNDDKIPQRVADYFSLPSVSSSLTLEGGAVHVDGQGLGLTTQQCLLNSNRNPHCDKLSIEKELNYWLGIETLIWLEQGLVDDHTDGHVDEVACFIEEGHVAALITEDKNDANYRVLQNNWMTLNQVQDKWNRTLRVTGLQQPEPRYLKDGTRLSLSYINFYLANNAVILPEFNQVDYDRAAQQTLQACYPDRTIVQLPVMDIFEGGGGIHCITQQQPTGTMSLNHDDEQSSV